MKKRPYLLFVALACAFLVSCSEDNDDPPPTPPIKTTEENLVARTWKLEDMIFLQNNAFGAYHRTGGGTTINLMNDRILFMTGGTGTYTNTYDIPFDFTWEWADLEKSKMTLVIKDYANGGSMPGTNLTMSLENVTASETHVRYTEIYTNQNGTKTISSMHRTPQ